MSGAKQRSRTLPIAIAVAVVIAGILWFVSQQAPVGDLGGDRSASDYEADNASRIARDAMPLAETARNMGVQDVTVEFKVGAVAQEGESIHLTDAPSPDQTFTVVVYGAADQSLASVSAAAENYVDRWVKVSSDIVEFTSTDGVATPAIRVTDRAQITVID